MNLRTKRTLNEIREFAGLTKEQVAAHLGMGVKQYAAFEEEPGRMYASDLQTLAELFGMDPNTMLHAVC